MRHTPPPTTHPALRCALWAWLGATAVLALPLQAQTVRCHLSYGGMTRTLHVPPTSCPQQVWPQVEGNSVSFKVVNAQAAGDTPRVTIDTQVPRGERWALAHRAQFLASGTTPQPHGFTGLQSLPIEAAEQELTYWCERVPAPATPSHSPDTCTDAAR